MGLKEKTVNSVLWGSIERFSVMGINFILSIIVARLVLPADFGVIAMTTIFLGVSNVFIDSGFANALVRKTDRTEIDNSTVFYFNIGVGITIYVIIFFSAPLIASFYNIPILLEVMRMIGLVILWNSLSVVQQAILTAKLDFKSQAKISLISVSASGIIGVILAYYGLGVWALVAQIVSAALGRMLLLWLYVKWLPQWSFSVDSFKSMFSYGSKLLMSNLVVTIGSSINSLIWGKTFPADQLGYYNRSEQFVNFPLNSITAIFQKVTFPVYCLRKDNIPMLREFYLKTICAIAILIAPAMAILFLLSQDIIILLLTEKWAPAAVLMQILIFTFAWSPIFSINMNILSVLGYTKYVLNIEIVKMVLRIAVILLAAPYGLKLICYLLACVAFFNTFIYSYYINKAIQVNWRTQMSYIIPYIVASVIIGIGVDYFIQIIESRLLRIIICLGIFLISYLVALRLFDRDNLNFLLSLLPRRSLFPKLKK